ncbi:MAG TPA: hypothetical protein VGJ17_05025, partial [Candidatus Limnocylindrales bacterium]
FILKNRAFVGQLLASGGIYRPAALLERLAPVLDDPRARVADLHVYTFNQVEATEMWRAEYLANP